VKEKTSTALRNRREFTKPSVLRRKEKLKAAYRLDKYGER